MYHMYLRTIRLFYPECIKDSQITPTLLYKYPKLRFNVSMMIVIVRSALLLLQSLSAQNNNKHKQNIHVGKPR